MRKCILDSGLTFSGNRNLADIKTDVIKSGGAWNTERYDAGEDRLSFTFHGRLVIYCPFNGTFITQKSIKGREELITESSVEMEKHKWYVDLLNLLYKPLKKAA